MAYTGHFLDFQEEVGKIRLNINKEVEGLMESAETLDCRDTGVAITHDCENQNVSTIFKDILGNGVTVKTESGTCVDFIELSTDDMVAIYEHIHYMVFPEEN